MPVAYPDVIEAPLEDARPAATPHLADLEHPWLGLESFREETRAYFFGRDTEIAELHLRLRSHPLLVVYGRSGLGKTSILSAGLIPRLCAEGQRPVVYRLKYKAVGPFEELFSALFVAHKSLEKRRPTPAWKQKIERISRWETDMKDMLATLVRPLSGEKNASELVVPFSFPQDAASRLWLRLHCRKEPPDITHLILDQFEEVFTLGARWAGTQDEIRDALAIILQGAIPEPISHLIAEHDVLLDHFDPDSMPVRVILALRDDYVYALNRWKRHLPALGQNNFELRALRGPAAFDAVFKPGELRCKYREAISEQNKVDTGLPPIVSKETAERIIRFVARKDEDVPLEEIEAVPPILSLLCRELNERRFTEPGGTPEMPARQITFSEGETDIATIITTFYERCLARRPEAVRIFIEEELVSPYSGARVPQDEHSILKAFTDGCEIPGAADDRRAHGYGDPAKARACLEDLVNQRLLTSLGGADNPSYELIHDLLAAVAEKSRTAREERFEKEQAERRAEAEKKAKDEAEARAQTERERVAALDVALEKETDARHEADRATRRARWLAIAAILVALVAAIASVVAFKARIAADKATKRVTLALDETDRQKREAERQRAGAVASKKAADELIDFMQYDLSGTLEKVGHLGMMDAVNARIRKYHEDHPPEASDLNAIREESVSFNQHGDVQRAQGDLAGALKSYRDSLAIREKLARQEPGNAGWQRDLSVTYDNVGNVQRDQGDLAGALKSYRDSLAIAEKLSKQDPGNADWQRDVSVSYNNVGDAQRAQGDLAGALKSYRDSLAIREKLTKQDPGNAGWQRDLSASYGRVGDVQRTQGDLAGALKSFRDSLAIAEKLARQDAGNAGWQRDLSVSYGSVGDVQSDQGDLAGALKSYRDSLAIREKLAKQDAGNAGWQRDLSASYYRVGDVQRAQGDLAGALKSYRDSLAIRENLAKQDAGNTGWQRDLSGSYDRVGDVQSDQGDLAGALKSYRDSLTIRENLAKQDAGNADWQRDLSVSLGRVGDVQRAQGDLAGALKSYGDTLAILEKLAKQDPGNAGWQRDLSLCYNRVGDVQRDRGNLAGALKSYRDSLAIAENLAKQDAGNAGWQRDLSVSLGRVGDMQRAQGDLASALKSYRDSLAILEKLARQDPGNAGWQRDLCHSYDRVGDVQHARGDLAGALKSYRESLAILEKLAKQDPGNANWQRDLSLSYGRAGAVQSDQGNLAGALKSYRDTLAILEKLTKQDPGNAGWQAEFALYCWRTGITLARSNPQSTKEARTLVGKGRDILRQLKTRTGLVANQQQWLDLIEADLRKWQDRK